jgi:D-alanyl-D-alanine carboxypeptidase
MNSADAARTATFPRRLPLNPGKVSVVSLGFRKDELQATNTPGGRIMRKGLVVRGTGALAILLSVTCVEPRDIAGDLKSLVEGQLETAGEDPIHNSVLLVESPVIKWKGAAGMADGISEVMTAEHAFKIASIGKTFTATVILQLMEEGRLGLDDTLGQIFDTSELDLERLHIHAGISYGGQITVEQLLGHTSGIRDYMEDERFIGDLLAEPDLQWGPAGILARYFDYGTNEKPAFPPGEGYVYADPNYVLLAMIIEKVTGSTLQEQYRVRIFDRLGMENSYLEFYEEPRGTAPLSHAFFGELDVNVSVNTSFDWGGGGIVSTCEELNTFFRALLHGDLFRRPSTLERMLAAADRGYGGEEFDYGLGIMKRIIGGRTFYGHGGAYDCDVFYSPDEDASVCMSLNQMNTHGKRDKFVNDAVDLLLQQR